MLDWVRQSVCQSVSQWVSQWVSESVSQWVNESVSESASESVSQWESRWVSESVSVCVSEGVSVSTHITGHHTFKLSVGLVRLNFYSHMPEPHTICLQTAIYVLLGRPYREAFHHTLWQPTHDKAEWDSFEVNHKIMSFIVYAWFDETDSLNVIYVIWDPYLFWLISAWHIESTINRIKSSICSNDVARPYVPFIWWLVNPICKNVNGSTLELTFHIHI